MDAQCFGCSDATVDDMDGGGGGQGGGATAEHLRLSYIKESRPKAAGVQPVVDLVVYDFEDDEEINLTNGEGVVDCITRSCQLNAGMTWVGWIEGGGRLKVAPVALGEKRIKTDEVREVADNVQQFSFTTFVPNPDEPTEGAIPQIVYSRGQQMGSDGTIDVYVEPVAGFDEDSCVEPTPECQSLIGTVTTNGGFRVTGIGSLVILIETTLSTMTLKFYNIATTAQQTLYTFGEMNMTGSQFSGRLPIGLAPDASFLAIFTNNEFQWRMHTLQAIPMPPPPNTQNLFNSMTSAQGDCQGAEASNEDGSRTIRSFNEVRFNPVFSADSEWIYFLAHGDCTQQIEPTSNRDDYDIFRMNRNLEGEPENVTRTARGNHWSNHSIGDFAVSPDGTQLVFSGERMNNRNSRAIWLINPMDGSYDCSRKAELPVPDGRTRCEFISDDSTDFDAVYRDLRFHEVLVPR